MNLAAKPHALDSAEPYVTMLAADTLRIERILPGPIERVWAYLTDSDKRARWLAAGPMDLRQGGPVMLTWRNADLSGGQTNPNGSPSADGVDHVIQGVITRCEQPHLLAFNWSADGSGSESTFELSQQGPDTKLVVTQRRVPNHKQMIGMSAGWHAHIGILIDLLSEGSPRSFWPEHTRLAKIYEERFAK